MKNHNNLTDSQIHNPKGFAPARKRTVLTKSQTGGVEWVKGNYTSSVEITCPADNNGQLHHNYFCIYSSKDAIKYAVYFQVTSTATISIPTGYNQIIAVDLTGTGENSTAIQVAAALQSTLNGHSDFSATKNETGVVTVTGLTTSSPAFDVSSNVGIIVTDTEVVNEVLHSDSSGDLKFKPFSEIMSGLNVLSDKSFIHNQSTASSTWVVQHNLDKHASVTVVDSAGTVVVGQVDYDSLDQITLSFKASFSGKAYFN